MIQCQNRPLDLLMFYDARLGTAMNNLFDLVTYWPKKGYYPFYLWSKMVARWTQIGCAVSVQKSKESNANTGNVEKKDKPTAGQFAAVAAKGKDGAAAVFVARYSDDGEPQGTAGVPMLETIRKSGVCDCVVVVTRYFGGILLGAGGLVRAYSHGAKIALDAAEIVTYEKYAEFSLECSYSDYQKYAVILPNFAAIIDDTEFTDKVKVSFAVKETVVSPLCEKITKMSGGRDRIQRTGERFDYR